MEKYTFEWFKKQKTLTMEHCDEIYQFYKLRYNANYPVFYHCMPEYNSSIANTQFKYVIFAMDTDKVFVAYKIITIMTTRQVRLFDAPISLYGNIEHEKQLLDKLKSLDFVKIAFKQNTPYLLEANELLEYNDFYIDFSVHKLSKRYLNMFYRCKQFDIQIKSSLSNFEIVALLDLRKTWSTYLSASKSSFKEFENILRHPVGNIRFIVVYYKDKPISVEIILITALNYANMLFEIKTREKICDTEMEQKFLNYGVAKLRNIYIRLLLKDWHMTRLYLAGCRPSEHRLLKHKQKISDGVIKYFLDDCNYKTQEISKNRKKLF